MKLPHLAIAVVALTLAGELAAQERERESRQQQTPFAQVFAIRDVELTKEQQTKIDALRKEYTPKLVELQSERNSVYTREQRQARREALQAARDAGKRNRELQEAVNKAIKLSEEQQEQLQSNQLQQRAMVSRIQKSIQALLTLQQLRQLKSRGNRAAAQGRQPAIAPAHRNLKYGPHHRNIMDVWLAKSEGPSPVLVSIHGGGFRGGNKGVDRNLLRNCLDAGISVVAITYRLSGDAIAPAQFYDSARAIQFIRHNAKAWNVDASRIASSGGSAGAGLSLWLGFHDDLADPDNSDPVLRQSSRLTCMSVYNGQTSYDPRFIRDLFPGTDTYKHSALAQLYDVDLGELDNLSKEKYALFELVSPITHLTKDDAPAQLIYASKMDTPITSQGIGIHHPKFAAELKKKMDPLGIECKILIGTQRGAGSSDATFEFVKKHFGME